MNSNTARWLCIKRFGMDELDGLHRIERTADRAWQENMKLQKPKQGTPGWREAGLPYLMRLNTEKGPYWPKSLDETARVREVELFERRMYPIWAPIFSDMAASKFTEIEAMHKADTAIRGARHRPAFQGVPIAETEEDYILKQAGNF